MRFTSFASLALLFGLGAVLLLVVRPSFAHLPDAEWAAGRRRVAERLEGLFQAALVGAAAATILAIVLQAVLIAEFGTGEVDTESLTAVFETSFGAWYGLRLPLLLALGAMMTGRVRDAALKGAGDERSAPGVIFWGGWLLLGCALLCTTSFSGHAAVAEPRSLALANDVVHLAAGSIWFTGVVLLAIVLPDAWAGGPAGNRLGLLTPAIVRFSRLALLSIGVVFATGVLNSLLHVGMLRDLWTTSYGRALALKLILFAFVLAFGAINHFWVRRRLATAATGPPAGAEGVFRKTIAAELVVALGIMAATGLLVGLARTKENVPPPQAPPPVEGDALSPRR